MSALPLRAPRAARTLASAGGVAAGLLALLLAAPAASVSFQPWKGSVNAPGGPGGSHTELELHGNTRASGQLLQRLAAGSARFDREGLGSGEGALGSFRVAKLDRKGPPFGRPGVPPFVAAPGLGGSEPGPSMPEPGAALLFGAGAAAVALRVRRR